MPQQVSSVAHAARTAVAEHQTLRALVRQVEAAFSRAGAHASSGPDVVAARLDTLRGPLRAHFDEEERAGLFEQIEAISPESASLCEKLRGEHGALIRRLDVLRTAAPMERRVAGWIGEVRRLLDDVHGHETRETDLLSRALDGSTPAGD